MCDTFVQIDGENVFFGKNSDREPGEAQLVVRVPAVSGDSQRRLRATHIEIDQTADRHAMILSKPFWMWGAEMGANERGVVIGNEAVFTRVMEPEAGLIGMDLLRLGLERGDTAEHALHVICRLLETYGQGGRCGYRDKRFRYDNSFVIADPTEAWVLETAGRHWAAKKVRDHAAISNCLTIGSDFDLKSAGIEDFAAKQGRFPKKGEFSFRDAFDTRLMPYFSAARTRLQTACEKLDGLSQKAPPRISGFLEILRTHSQGNDNPARGGNADICMHAGGPLIRRSQTCGAMVSRLHPSGQLHLMTGTSAPCLSIFKPADVQSDRDFYVLSPEDPTAGSSLWHQWESVHRRLLFSEKDRRLIQAERDAAENQMIGSLDSCSGMPPASRLAEADETAAEWSNQWIARCRKTPFQYPVSPYGAYWRWMNRKDKIL